MKTQKSFKVLLPILLSMTLAACADDDDNPSVNRGALLASESPVLSGVDANVDSNAVLESWANDLWQLLADCFSEGIVFNGMKLLIEQVNPRTVNPVVITYESADVYGNRLELTGALLIPQTVFKQHFPLISLQHGTQLLRLVAPSKMAANPRGYAITESFEVILGYLLARAGYIVAIPDYPGMGNQTPDNPGFHPYVHGRSLAIAVVDMLRASRAYLEKNQANLNVSWNGQLFLMGYSEGGYATLAAAREIQQNHASEFNLTATAPLSGPHDLSGVMLPVMLGQASNSYDFPAPYFLPYVVKGYETVYGPDLYGPKIAYATGYAETLPPLMDGFHDSKTVGCAIAEMQNLPTTGDCHAALPPILNPSFSADLSNTDSAAFKNLKNNNLYLEDLAGACTYANAQGDCVWIPQTPVGFFHHPADDLVPFQNSQNAFDQFKAAGAARVELNQFQCQAPLSQTMHVNAALPALMAGYGWIAKFYQ